MKIKIDWDNDLPLEKTLNRHSVVLLKSLFLRKVTITNFQQVYIYIYIYDKYLPLLYDNKTDYFDNIDVTKISASTE